jgi:hypothetical protein
MKTTSERSFHFRFDNAIPSPKMNQNLKGATSQQTGTHADVKPTPRVNKALLPNYIGQIVRLVGVLKNMTPLYRELEAADHQIVQVLTSKDSAPYGIGATIEIVGRVKDQNTVEELSSCLFDTSTVPFDLNLYNQFLLVAQQNREIFGL